MPHVDWREGTPLPKLWDEAVRAANAQSAQEEHQVESLAWFLLGGIAIVLAMAVLFIF